MNIKAFLLLNLLIIIGFCDKSFANSEDNMLKQADSLFKSQNYEQSLQIYLSLEEKYSDDWRLYYNIGNMYMKISNIPSAILYYERALRLNPADKQLKENIKIANSRLKGEIIPLSDFFLWRWIKDISSLFFPTMWAIIVLCLLLLSCAVFCIYYFSEKHKIPTFYVFLFLSIATLASFSLGLVRTNLINQDNYAIIFDANGIISEQTATTKLGNQKRLRLFNGEKVEIVERNGNILTIRTLDGNKTKVKADCLKII
ncbi:MAG: tetratricopeptide repeat protein [Bacteroidales bacterium]|jgi:tetratricopeptide (TPR) repeat protein|nr:tetratricopeptide repeat protein [Bacteroidales bacterium]